MNRRALQHIDSSIRGGLGRDDEGRMWVLRQNRDGCSRKSNSVLVSPSTSSGERLTIALANLVTESKVSSEAYWEDSHPTWLLSDDFCSKVIDGRSSFKA